MVRGSLAQAQERRVQNDRRQQLRIQETKAYYGEQKFYDSLSRSVERGNVRAAAREMAEIEYQRRQREAAEAEAASRQVSRCQREAAIETDAAKRDAELKTEREKKLKDASVQRSHGLQELQRRLAAVQVENERDAQVASAAVELIRAEEIDSHFALESSITKAVDCIQGIRLEDTRRAETKALQDALQAQMTCQANLRQAAKEEAAKNKKGSLAPFFNASLKL